MIQPRYTYTCVKGKAAAVCSCPRAKTLWKAGELSMIDPKARQILEFWFPESFKDQMDLWFGKSAETDKFIIENFKETLELAKANKLNHWHDNPLSCLAFCILLDQFSRNVYREDKEMYAADPQAISCAVWMMLRNHTCGAHPAMALFMCLVFTHSELLVNQFICCEIWREVSKSLPEDSPLKVFEPIFEKHLVVIDRFGRFPHRNEILGRESTEEEKMFLEDKSFRFDLPLKTNDDGGMAFESTNSFRARSKLATSAIGDDYSDSDCEEMGEAELDTWYREMMNNSGAARISEIPHNVALRKAMNAVNRKSVRKSCFVAPNKSNIRDSLEKKRTPEAETKKKKVEFVTTIDEEPEEAGEERVSVVSIGGMEDNQSWL